MRWISFAVAAVVLANLAILAAHLWLQRTASPAAAAAPALPISNFAVVDDHLWRGAAPSAAGYRALADHGVTTIVDLRAEHGIEVDDDALRDLGITRFHLPLRDGQAPSADLVRRFLEITGHSGGRVYVHCGAGVGRTGTMAAAYLVDRGEASPLQAVRRNLTVGPPSLEQLAFAAGWQRPPMPVVALSRLLDAPRRTWVNVRGSYTKSR